MVAKLLKAFDATVDFGLNTFKKVLMFAVLIAIIAAGLTASIIILGYNIVL